MSLEFSVTTPGKSKCLPSDVKCKKKEDEAAARAALAKKEAEKGKYKPPPMKVGKSSTGLVCTMDGMTKMV